jgi:hypothetical protein
MKKILLSIACLASFQLQGMEYVVLFENDQACVSRVKILAREEIGLHRDEYPETVVALQGGTITRLEPDGRTTEVKFPTGEAVERPADPVGELHKSFNHSSEPLELIVIQWKMHLKTM